MQNRVVVAYYSRSGHTRALGQEICRLLENGGLPVETVEIEPECELGTFKFGTRSLTGASEPVKECDMGLNEANLLLLGTSVWGGNPAPYLRGLMDQVRDLRGLPVVLFTTCAYGDSDAEQDLREMVRTCGGRPMEYHVWRTRRDGNSGLSDVAEDVVASVQALLPH